MTKRHLLIFVVMTLMLVSTVFAKDSVADSNKPEAETSTLQKHRVEMKRWMVSVGTHNTYYDFEGILMKFIGSFYDRPILSVGYEFVDALTVRVFGSMRSIEISDGSLGLETDYFPFMVNLFGNEDALKLGLIAGVGNFASAYNGGFHIYLGSALEGKLSNSLGIEGSIRTQFTYTQIALSLKIYF